MTSVRGNGKTDRSRVGISAGHTDHYVLTPERRRELHEMVDAILESEHAKLLRDLLDALYQHVLREREQ